MVNFLLWCYLISIIGMVLFIIIEKQVTKHPNANKFTKWWREHIVTEYTGEDF